MILVKLKKPQRCSTCGGMIRILPCLLCHPEAGYYEEKKAQKTQRLSQPRHHRRI